MCVCFFVRGGERVRSPEGWGEGGVDIIRRHVCVHLCVFTCVCLFIREGLPEGWGEGGVLPLEQIGQVL